MNEIRGQALCIINPAAGRKGQGETTWISLQPIISRYYNVSVLFTKKHHDNKASMKEIMAGMDIIVCVGGDGTLNEVAAAVMQSGFSIPILYVPAGTANDFAYTIRASRDLETINELLSDGIIIPHIVGFVFFPVNENGTAGVSYLCENPFFSCYIIKYRSAVSES